MLTASSSFAPLLPRRLLAAFAAALAGAVLVVAAPAVAPPTKGISWGTKEMAAIDPSLDALVAGGRRTSVIVQADGGRAEAVAAAIAGLPGTAIGQQLPIVDGFEATVGADALDVLAGRVDVVAVTPNRVGSFDDLGYDASTTAATFAKTTAATAAWAEGNLGEGIGVAIIDTGVAEMPDLAGRIVHGPDLSGEGTTHDSYGHGTVLAGLIAGSGADSAGAAGGTNNGMAPKAHVVSVKAAGRNGATDVSTILAAMHWVSAYQDQFGIRVLNLSWGTRSVQPALLDPLNYAVQRLWQQGIVVVVAAGNAGPGLATITKPADDPLVLTVGAVDDRGTPNRSDDSIPQWSSRGPALGSISKPDVVAPGRTLIATRAFGSQVEADNPDALVAPSYIRGSGTSQAAAITSGAAALLLADRPSLTPDQVKKVLKTTAVKVNGPGASPFAQGSGSIDVAAALDAAPGGASTQTPTATGLGLLELSRAGDHVETDCGEDGTVDVIQGEIDVRCEAWDPLAWTGSTWSGDSWTGSTWSGSTWSGSTWSGSTWSGSTWSGSTWSGGTWEGDSWHGTPWTGSTWSGSTWSGSTWSGSTWSGSTWSGSTWSGSTWSGRAHGSDSEFQTAFWGRKPAPGLRIAGEIFEALCQRRPRIPVC